MPRAKRGSNGRQRKASRPCTYELGYVRQDLYACRKCSKEANETLSGFCRGCRDVCHSDHLSDVIELYTKRSFRCDCGNTRDKITCQLCPNKEDLNIGNERCYSHNFEGRYCRCDREYDFRLEMAQCAMCEDWFHEECYKTDALRRGGSDTIEIDYELICKECVKRLPELSEYYETHNAWAEPAFPAKSGSHGVCVRPKSAEVTIKPGTIDYIWRPGFRLALCRCNECMDIYNRARAMYIVDRHDFVSGADQDDSSVLKDTDDEEIVNDVLEAEEAERRKGVREKAMNERERIPRKPMPRPASAPNGVASGRSVTESLSATEVINIRRKINSFLRDSIESNGGNLNRESVLEYLSNLKADLLNTFRQRLQS